MKKQYVKPVMESEIFIANEYVAACYWIECKQGACDNFQGSYYKGNNVNNVVNNSSVLHAGSSYNVTHSCYGQTDRYFHLYNETDYDWIKYRECHEVSIELCSKEANGMEAKAHPNASV